MRVLSGAEVAAALDDLAGGALAFSRSKGV